jgi:hypothetical protein
MLILLAEIIAIEHMHNSDFLYILTSQTTFYFNSINLIL